MNKQKAYKFRGFVDEYEVDYPVEGQWKICIIRACLEGIEIELRKLTVHKNSIVIHSKVKSFDFDDMLLMNDTINKIVGRKQ